MIDSLTHAWAGEGGLLDQKETIDRTDTKGSSYTHWATISKKHEKLRASLLQSDIHLVATMRSKQDYLIVEGDGKNGKGSVRKVGLAPIQREGMEYEFTVVFDMVMSHEATISKDRTGLFDGQVFQPNKKTGETISTWLASGKEAVTGSSKPVATAKAEPTPEKAKASTPAPEKKSEPAQPGAKIYRTWHANGDTRPHAVAFKKNGWQWVPKDTTWIHGDMSKEIDKTQPWLVTIGKLAGVKVTFYENKGTILEAHQKAIAEAEISDLCKPAGLDPKAVIDAFEVKFGVKLESFNTSQIDFMAHKLYRLDEPGVKEDIEAMIALIQKEGGRE